VTAVPAPGRKRRSRAGVALSGREAFLLLVPALLPVLVLSVAPLARGIYLGFTDSRAGFGVPTKFIGLDNFRKLLHDDLFVNSFKIGLIWAGSVTAIQFCLALGLALLLSQPLRLRWLARSLALVPWAMPSVIVAIMWKLFFQPQAGVLNELLYRAHLPGSNIDWLSNFTWALPAVILVGVWAGMPQTTVALLAGLQSISDDLHEAAAVDGASTWQRFRSITLPQLRPVIVAIMWKLFFQPQAGVLNEILYRAHLPGSNIDWLSNFSWALPAVILVGVWQGMPQTTVALLAGVQSIQDELHEAAAVDGAGALRRFWTITLPQLRPVIIAITSLDLIWNFNTFGTVWVLTQGGPGHKTELPMLFAYNEAFKYGEFGYAAALGDAMVVVIACVLAFYLWGRLKETTT
jgi:multiple sugar transport system permease protein